MDLVVISVCLTVLVCITAALEFSVMKLKRAFEHNIAISQMLHKVISELMILGVISFSTALVLSFNSGSDIIQHALAEFELAHIWLFLVGILYVVNAVNMMLNLESIKDAWTKFDDTRISSVEKLIHNSKHQRRPRWSWLVFGSGSGTSGIAEFKVLKLFFMQQNWDYLEHQLGSESHVKRFDYAQYIRSVVTEEIIELLEVRPLTWVFFIVVMWLSVAGRTLAGLRYDNDMTALSVGAGWFLFIVVGSLVLEAHLGTLRLHGAIKASFELDSDRNEQDEPWGIEDTFKRLCVDGVFRKPSNIERRVEPLEEEAGATEMEEVEAGAAEMEEAPMVPSIEKSDYAAATADEPSEKSTEMVGILSGGERFEGSAEKSDEIASPESVSAEGLTEDSPRRTKADDDASSEVSRFSDVHHHKVHKFTRMTHKRALNLMSIGPKSMSRMSELIIFVQCFMLGSLLLISLPETTNKVKHYGITLPSANSSNYSRSNPQARHLAAAGGESGHDLLPTDVTPAWAKCSDFDPGHKFLRKGAAFYTVTFVGHGPYTADGEHYKCTVWSNWYGPLLIVLALIPQLLVMFWLQPLYVKNYCYFAAVTLGRGELEENHHRRSVREASDRPSNMYGEEDRVAEHEGHLDSAAFGRILSSVFDRMHEDESVAHLYRTIINNSVRKRAVEKRKVAMRCRSTSVLEQLEGLPNLSVDDFNRMSEEDLNSVATQFCTEEMYNKERHLLFNEMDTDNTGRINHKEFRVGMDSLLKDTGQRPLSTQRFRRLLRLFDRDHSGTINEDEFHRFLVDEEFEWPADEFVKALHTQNLKLRKTLSQLWLQDAASSTGRDVTYSTAAAAAAAAEAFSKAK